MKKPIHTGRAQTGHPDPAQTDGNPVLDLHIQHLLVAVEHELRQCPEGMSELALIKRLQGQPWELIGDVAFGEPEKLYPVHFLLFHTLYRLRDQLAGQGETVSISPLSLRLQNCAVVAGAGLMVACAVVTRCGPESISDFSFLRRQVRPGVIRTRLLADCVLCSQKTRQTGQWRDLRSGPPFVKRNNAELISNSARCEPTNWSN